MNQVMKHVSSHWERHNQQRRDERTALRHAFAGAMGEAALALLVRMVDYGAPAYVPGHDALEAAYRDGRKSVVHEILQLIQKTENHE